MSMMRGHAGMIVVLLALSHAEANGQESDKLLRETTGWLLLDEKGSGLKAIQFPTLEKTIVRAAADEKTKQIPTFHSRSGPDAEGRIAFIEDHFFGERERDKRHELKTIRLDGSQEVTFFTRPGDAMWAATAAGKGQIGGALALSPVGGRVAFHTDLKPLQLPEFIVSRGSIEIWDVASKQSSKIQVDAMNARLEWLPDGKRLVYVKMADPKVIEVIASAREDTFFEKKHLEWEKLPCVFIRDVDAGTEAFLHVGTGFLVSPDGQRALVFDNESRRALVDVATGESRPVTWHDQANKDSGPVSFLANDILLTSTTTWKPQPKRRGLFSSLDPQIPVRAYSLVRLNTDEFQVLTKDEFK